MAIKFPISMSEWRRLVDQGAVKYCYHSENLSVRDWHVYPKACPTTGKPYDFRIDPKKGPIVFRIGKQGMFNPVCFRGRPARLGEEAKGKGGVKCKFLWPARLGSMRGCGTR